MKIHGMTAERLLANTEDISSSICLHSVELYTSLGNIVDLYVDTTINIYM
jgi:hypothetical protein